MIVEVVVLVEVVVGLLVSLVVVFNVDNGAEGTGTADELDVTAGDRHWEKKSFR